uniref:hypothetical protein n=1 Tax=Streptomyces sp. WAC05458 TaxID=2487412 RepID=UPI0021AFA584|nr:hypothetical protein [Streptomyces sp. WAC05458]
MPHHAQHPPTSIEPPDDKAVIELISPDRLNPCLTACAGDSAAALKLYQWNSDLAAAFFELLGHLEIMLRNALDARLAARQQRRGRATEWYIDRQVPLTGKVGNIAQCNAATSGDIRSGTAAPPPPSRLGAGHAVPPGLPTGGPTPVRVP